MTIFQQNCTMKLFRRRKPITHNLSNNNFGCTKLYNNTSDDVIVTFHLLINSNQQFGLFFDGFLVDYTR